MLHGPPPRVEACLGDELRLEGALALAALDAGPGGPVGTCRVASDGVHDARWEAINDHLLPAPGGRDGEAP
eukprot:4214307-Lingulodinium_polyedra.AAC.1